MIKDRSLILLALSFSFTGQLLAIPPPGVTEAVRGDLSIITKSGGIERDYRAGKLSEAQEEIVIALAKKQGIAKVVKIRTYNIHPSAARGISVQGAEITTEREVSYQVLNINYKKWFLQ